MEASVLAEHTHPSVSWSWVAGNGVWVVVRFTIGVPAGAWASQDAKQPTVASFAAAAPEEQVKGKDEDGYQEGGGLER